jgi:translation initiation factor 2B subunit (eIF-2B alpha/beta/delta family)
MDHFSQCLEEIVQDKEQGATQLARVALRALMECCQSLKVDNAQSFLTASKKAVGQISHCRPSMAPIANWAREFHHLLAERLKEVVSVSDCSAYATEVGQHLLQAQDVCLRKQIELARPFLHKFRGILTLSYSSTVEKLLLEAGPPSAEIIVLESRPLCEGRKLALALHRQHRSVRLVTEAQAALFMPQVDLVLVGADTVCSDLAVVNKVGTKMLCLLARESNVTSAVAADTYKILPDTTSEQIILEEKDSAEVWHEYWFLCRNIYFEPTPASLIDHFITERGILSVAEMKQELDRLRALHRSLAD